jgi:superfamily II DNA or RNA helicase
VSKYAVLRPHRQPTDPRRPLAHQSEARNRLSEAHLSAGFTGALEGLLVMPTGAGKTFTAVGWLMHQVVDRGGRVLWLAHRDELLAQAAAEFYRAVGCAPRRDHVNVRVVSSRHGRADEIRPDDDVVVASAATLARHPGAPAALLADPRTFVVVDEAHHAPAATFRAVLDPLRAAGRHGLLGLTATPTRTRADERPVLAGLFGDRVIYEADGFALTERGVLARPVLVRINTGTRIDEWLDAADLSGLGAGRDFGPAALRRVARLERRNGAVVDHLLTHRHRYGKTVVFVSTVAQARALAGRLRAAGVAADYVASGRRDTPEVLRRFRGRGGPDVLLSVGILAEGVDLPAARAVVLARPTASPILASQMVGRALRGPAVGGTEEAYLVALRDDWGRLDPWPDPLDLVPDVVERASPPWAAAGGALARWGDLEALSPLVRSLIPAEPTDASESVTDRWYVLGDPAAGPGSAAVAVYSHQRGGWERAVAHLAGLPAADLAAADAVGLREAFFGDCGPPAPPAWALGRLVDHFRGGGGPPACYSAEERQACDPRAVARRVADEDLGERARTRLLDEQYTPLARAIYPTLRDYRAAVDDALFSLQQPAGWAGVELPAPVFEAA